jgi:hypothetical protein
MSKKEGSGIDALFGSKTRVKLLHLFLNNPGKSFYVREITRLIDEQINSVRRELSNMLGVGVITSKTADNKLYYEIDQQYELYEPFRKIFTLSHGDQKKTAPSKAGSLKSPEISELAQLVATLSGLRVAVAAGILVKGSASNVDLLLVGSLSATKLKGVVGAIEKNQGRAINYAAMSYDEFYYRMSVRDRFVSEILSGKHDVLVDADNIVKTSN